MTLRLLLGETGVMQIGLCLIFSIVGKWIEIFAVLTSACLNLSQFWTEICFLVRSSWEVLRSNHDLPDQ